MNKKYKDKWVKALRSGKYEQGKGQLKTRDKEYCCLGVLCEISGLGKFKEDTCSDTLYPEDEVFYFILRNSEQGIKSSLSNTLRYEFGISEGESVTLMNMNDERNKSFEEIANYIEENM